MPYRLPPLQNQHTFPNLIPTLNQGNALRGTTPDISPGLTPRNYAMSPTSYVGSTYPGIPGVQYPIPYPGGLMSNRPSTSSGAVHPSTSNSQSVASSSVNSNLGAQVEGCSNFSFSLFLPSCIFRPVTKAVSFDQGLFGTPVPFL